MRLSWECKELVLTKKYSNDILKEVWIGAAVHTEGKAGQLHG